jgi:hypothetical protein
MVLTSDPHAWLRPYYVALKNDGAFWMLAGPQRFAALCCAVEPEYPTRAASMRKWSPAAKAGILKWLESVTREKPAVQEVELWRVLFFHGHDVKFRHHLVLASSIGAARYVRAMAPLPNCMWWQSSGRVPMPTRNWRSHGGKPNNPRRAGVDAAARERPSDEWCQA